MRLLSLDFMGLTELFRCDRTRSRQRMDVVGFEKGPTGGAAGVMSDEYNKWIVRDRSDRNDAVFFLAVRIFGQCSSFNFLSNKTQVIPIGLPSI